MPLRVAKQQCMAGARVGNKSNEQSSDIFISRWRHGFGRDVDHLVVIGTNCALVTGKSVENYGYVQGM